jgi:hypothetical protein
MRGIVKPFSLRASGHDRFRGAQMAPTHFDLTNIPELFVIFNDKSHQKRTPRKYLFTGRLSVAPPGLEPGTHGL